MVKTEALELELSEIGRIMFNLPWCTGYSPKRYRNGLELLIYKDPNDLRPHRLRPILLFDKESNMHNKSLGWYAMKHTEELEGIEPGQYGRKKSKAANLQALNTRLF